MDIDNKRLTEEMKWKQQEMKKYFEELNRPRNRAERRMQKYGRRKIKNRF